MKWDGRLWQVLGICGLASAGSLIVVGCVQGPRVTSARFWDRKAAAVDEKLAEDDSPAKDGPLSRKSLSAKSLAARTGRETGREAGIHDERDPFAARDAESKQAGKPSGPAGVSRVSQEVVAGRVPPAYPSGEVVAPYIRKRTPNGAIENDKHNAEIVRTDRPRSKELYPTEPKSATALHPQNKPLPHPSTQTAAAKTSRPRTASSVAAAGPQTKLPKRTPAKAELRSDIDRQLADIRASIADEEREKPKAASRLASSHDDDSAGPAVHSAAQFVEEDVEATPTPKRSTPKRAAAQSAKATPSARPKSPTVDADDPFAELEASGIKATPTRLAGKKVSTAAQNEGGQAARLSSPKSGKPDLRKTAIAKQAAKPATTEDPSTWSREPIPQAELTSVEPIPAKPATQPRQKSVMVIPDRAADRNIAAPIADTAPADKMASTVSSTANESMIVDSNSVRGQFAEIAPTKSTSFSSAHASRPQSAEHADASANHLAASRPTSASLDSGEPRSAKSGLANAALRPSSKPESVDVTGHSQTQVATSVEQGWTAIDEPAPAAKKATVTHDIIEEKACATEQHETRAARAKKVSHKRDRGEAWFIMGMATGLGASVGLWFHLRRRPATVTG